MTTFYLIRHAEPDYTVIEKNQRNKPQYNLAPLTAAGILQAEKVAKDPRLKNATIIVSSPYTRALQTAALINNTLQLPLRVEYDLHEWLPNLTSKDMTPDEILQDTVSDFLKHKGVYPDGQEKEWETMASVQERVGSILDKYTHHRDEEKLR